MNKETLLIASTHGDEKIGLEIIKELKEKRLEKYFDYIIGNPKAEKLNKRFIEKDLNRSYPGSNKSTFYEEKLAYENLQIAKKYKYIIDIHEARQGINDFIIVARKELGSKFPFDKIALHYILLWPDPKGPLCSILENAIELEFGMKNRDRKKVIRKAISILSEFFLQKQAENKTQKIFYVYDKLKISEYKNQKELNDFRLTKVDKEKFYPLLVDQYLNLDIKCYKMKKKIT